MSACKRFATYLAMAASLAACGRDDGGDGFSVGETSTPGSGTSYAFVPPVLNSKRVYAETVVDNSSNSINIGYSETVTAIASDGTITEQQQSTTGVGVAVDGTNYSLLTETQTYNSFGRETGYTYTESDGNPGSCTYTPYAGGAMPPYTVGMMWTVMYTATCNANAPIDYSQQGEIADLETVTVPAGTFSALKLQSTITWTDLSGTTHTETSTNWLDVATFHSVKQSITYVDSGTLPANGYAVSREIVLASET